jgi:hypothetical protein
MTRSRGEAAKRVSDRGFSFPRPGCRYRDAVRVVRGQQQTGSQGSKLLCDSAERFARSVFGDRHAAQRAARDVWYECQTWQAEGRADMIAAVQRAVGQLTHINEQDPKREAKGRHRLGPLADTWETRSAWNQRQRNFVGVRHFDFGLLRGLLQAVQHCLQLAAFRFGFPLHGIQWHLGGGVLGDMRLSFVQILLQRRYARLGSTHIGLYCSLHAYNLGSDGTIYISQLRS